MFLLVEDDLLVARGLLRFFGPRRAIHASSATEARKVAKTRPLWRGYFVDPGLPEGPNAGLKLLESLIEHDGGAERVIITGRPDEVASAADRLEATLFSKPPDLDGLAAVLRRCDEKSSEDPCETALDRGNARYGLTAREAGLVAHTAAGLPASTYARTVGVAESTYKTHRNGIRRKSGAASPELLALRMFREELRRRR